MSQHGKLEEDEVSGKFGMNKMATICPICGGKRISQCRCHLSESECENGHEWHYHGDVPMIGNHKEGDCQRAEMDLSMAKGLVFVKRHEIGE